MDKIKCFFFFCVLFLPFVQEVTAQNSKEVYQRKGKEYYGHVVEKGNTFYSISKEYSISIEDIKKHNPHTNNELSIGDTIWISLKKINKKDVQYGTNNSNYLTYKVQEKNTLYSIAKEYDVEIKDIVLANPELQNGLKVGMELNIPLSKLRKEEVEHNPTSLSRTDKYKTRLVKPKETLYSLSKQYNVEIDSILILNDGLAEGLKVGQEIVLPIEKEKRNNFEPKGIEFDSSKLKNTYNIALLLPFYLDKIQEPSDTTSFGFQESEQVLFKHAKYGIELYEGFVLALDSMRRNGLTANLHVFDAANDTAKIEEIISKPVMKEMDLIIGPLFFSEFMIAANFAKKHQIDIISPVKQSNKILLGNKYVSKVISSHPVLIKSLAGFVADSLMNENVVVLYSDNVKERINLEQFNEAFAKASRDTSDSLPIKKPVIFEWKSVDSFQALKEKIKPDTISSKKNYIVVLSDNQAMVTQLLTSLNNIQQKYDISVLGLEDWENYSNLDVDYLHNLNVHLIVPEFIDETEDKVITFKNKFKDAYGSNPGNFAFLGYDVGYYYLSLLNRYGNNIRFMYDKHKMTGLSRSFNFHKTGIESGYENQSFNIVKYQNYDIKKVK